jgi:aminoglycoside 3-N-acetyltransferase
MKKIFFDYNHDTIKKSLKKCNIKKNDCVYVSGNLLNLGRCKIENFKKIPELLFKVIVEIIGKKGTIIVPAHTFYLANTNKTFDIKNSKSISGSFSNFILKQKKVVRQDHPFSSSAAIGKKAKYICNDNTNHVYGPNSPFERMIKLNTKFLSLGLPVNLNCSQVHHAELIMNVPYRYHKRFIQKIKKKDKIYKKEYYMFVIKEKYLDLKRNKNKIIFKNFNNREKIFKSKLGANFIYSYSIKKFFQRNKELLKKDIFCWVGKKLN